MTSVTKLNLRKLIKRVQMDVLKCQSLEGLSKETIDDLEKINCFAIADSITAEKIVEESEEGKKQITEMMKTYLTYEDKLQSILKSREVKDPKKEAPVVVPVAPAPEKKAEPKEPEKKAEPVKVVETVPEAKQTQNQVNANKKGRNWWKYVLTAVGTLGTAALILFLLRSCGDKNKNQGEVTPPPTTTPRIEQEADAQYYIDHGIENFNIDDVNINDYNELTKAAQIIQGILPEDQKFSIEEIQYAIVLANFDKLENKEVFREAEEIYSATRTMGIVMDDLKINADDLIKSKHPEITVDELTQCLVNVTDLALTVDDFAYAKTETGYDVYKVLEICGAQIDLEGDEDKAFEYAKVFNDIVSQTTRNFTMLEGDEEYQASLASLPPMYVILGMYNANMERILELCGGRHLSTIYGTGIRNDGTYGDICVEELAASSRIVYENGGYSGSEYSEFLNQNGAFIDLLTDENNKGIGR